MKVFVKMKVFVPCYFCTKMWLKKMRNGGLILQSCVFQDLEGQIVKKNIYISH